MNDSDEDFGELEELPSVRFFSRANSISALTTTIPCRDKNIKGNTLIQIVHKLVSETKDDAINLACEYERERDGPAGPTPLIQGLSLVVQRPSDWFMTLGGWKGMMPDQEEKDYFFFQESFKEGEKFDSVKIFNNDVKFPIKNHRIHVPDGFQIGEFDVTSHWKQENNKWVLCTGKTDLSYKQIVKAIDYIKDTYSINDSSIAQLQRWCLHRTKPKLKPDRVTTPISARQREIIIFLDYLNALMFGIEASGLNAALLTGAMMLDIIVDGLHTYKDAFYANDEGGIYPYACFGNNQGTYSAREAAMLREPPSMSYLRTNPSLSPVAIKEVIIIKAWLEHARVLDNLFSYEEQCQEIRNAIIDLEIATFSPRCPHNYFTTKFKSDPHLNHTESAYRLRI